LFGSYRKNGGLEKGLIATNVLLIMKRINLNDISELQHYYKSDLYFDYLKPFVFIDIDFNFNLGQNFIILHKLQDPSSNGSISTTFSSIQHYIFKNCKFNYELNIISVLETKLTFESNCEFGNINFNDATINKHVRFYDCKFTGNCNFVNTKFLDLADFWNSTFNLPISFYKTDFLGTTVFSACTFKENVLFTYSLFDKKIIFRGATFLKGLDLSLAINSGEYNFFNISLNNFSSTKHLNETEYNDMIEGCVIPTINKKETFRIIKQHFQNNGDDLEYVKYLRLEKKPIFEIITTDFKKTKRNQFWNYIHHIFDIISLSLNRVSNNHRNSYSLGILFTISAGLLFFWFSVLSFPDYQFQWNPSKWYMDNFWKNYLTFMNPTHDVEIFKEFRPTGWTYFWQTWGRIFVGYGIYQTVQAFRKLK
jgi:hypothetical protein